MSLHPVQDSSPQQYHYQPDCFGSDQKALHFSFFVLPPEKWPLASGSLHFLLPQEFDLLNQTVRGNPELEKLRLIQLSNSPIELQARLKSWVTEFKDEFEPELNSEQPLLGFYSHWLKAYIVTTHFFLDDSVAPPGPTLYFDTLSILILASVLPGSVPLDDLPRPRLQQALPLWKDLVIFETLVQKAKSRSGQPKLHWLEDDMQSLLELEQAHVPEGPLLQGYHSHYSPEPFCERPFQQITVTCEGDIAHCCWQMSAGHVLGNVLKNPIEKIWKSQIAHEIQHEVQRGRLHDSCQYSPGCPHHSKKVKKTRMSWAQPQPRYIDLHLPNSLCNIGGKRPSIENPACIMCERSLKDYQFQDDTQFNQVLEKLADLLPELNYLHIQGTAEPFWHGQIFNVLKTLRFAEHAPKIRLTTTTNGTVFTPDKQMEFLEIAPQSTLSLSLDAATPLTYQRIRRLNMFKTVLEHAQNFSKLRRRDGSSYFRVQNNINLYNVAEVVDMVHIAADLAVDEIVFNATETHLPELMVTNENAWRFQEAQARAEQTARSLGLKIIFFRPLDLNLGVINE